MPDAQPMTEAMYYVLLALRTPAHGYGLLGRIREISGGRLEMGPGTLYGILTRLKKEGLIELAAEDERAQDLRPDRVRAQGPARGIRAPFPPRGATARP